MAQAWRVGVWCAVSSKPQASDEKESLPAQEAAGHAFASAVGGEVVAVYRVPGHSRDLVFFSEAERAMPAYVQARSDIEGGRIDVLFTASADRLGRDPALISQFYSLAQRHGCEIYNAEMPHQLGQQTVGHRYGVAVGAVAAGEDQTRRIHRHRMGMQGRVKRGYFGSTVPHGYTAVRDELGRVTRYEFTDGIHAIDLITRLYLAGHSLSEIRRRLNDSGHPPPQGRLWNRKAIRNIMHNDAYAGYPKWGSVTAQEVSDKYPAPWDAATHAAIVRERHRRDTGPYVRTGGGPLTGVAYCGRCGQRMARNPMPSAVYLRCRVHALRNQSGDGTGCHSNYIREDAALGVLSDFFRRLATPGNVERILAAMEAMTGQDDAAADLAQAKERITDLDARRERLALAFAAGDMDAAIYRRADDALLAQLVEQQGRAGELRRYLEAVPDIGQKRDSLLWLLRHFDALVEEQAPATVAKALQDAGFRVIVEESEARVEWLA